jgi:hypothetical protein
LHCRLQRILKGGTTSEPQIIESPLSVVSISDEEIRDVGEDVEREVTLLNVVAQSNSSLNQHAPVLSKGLARYRKVLRSYDEQQQTGLHRLDLTHAEDQELVLERMQFRVQTLRKVHRHPPSSLPYPSLKVQFSVFVHSLSRLCKRGGRSANTRWASPLVGGHYVATLWG